MDSRIRLLQACQRPAKTPEDAATAIADGTVALVDWWKMHRFVAGGSGTESFRLSYVGQYEPLKACAPERDRSRPGLQTGREETRRKRHAY